MAAPRPKLRRTWPQRLLLGVNCVLVVACLGAAFTLSTFEKKFAEVDTVAIDSATAKAIDVDKPRNILIIGTDSAANLAEDDPVQNGREGERLADVIMILRIDPANESARILSIPRDTRVELAPSGDTGRINASIAGVDGPRNLISTIKRNFGVSIDNFIEVDFAAFRDLVDLLGGVPVHFAVPVRDKNTGLNITEPGCVTLDPVQALAYARSRHFQFQQDGKWRFDQTGDLGRITRQQDFIKRSLRKASEKGLRNPGTAIGIVDAASKSVVTDDSLSVGTILDLLGVFRTFNPDDLVTNQIPTVAAPRGGVAYQEADLDAAAQVLLAVWGYDEQGNVDTGDIIVDLAVPEDRTEAAALVATAFDERGFDAEPLTVRSSEDRTTLTFGAGGFNAALEVARHLQDVPVMVLDEDLIGPRVVLGLPEEFGGLRDQPVDLAALPAEVTTPPEELRPEESASSDGSTSEGTTSEGTTPEGTTSDGTTSDGTSTSLPSDSDPEFLVTASEDGTSPGVVPTDPEKASACR